ncbi:MAG TPA: multidrug ABC transporter ATP-binding protein [Alphaproteobacteria bacterium]|nr:multidrug ABC transporter ATP-binding protein [Alphaproteobacteria bacterium]HAJ46337.1 multidrug ABC transporter ATP-binding protein [Alphaproteobacteria bacterium]
MNPIVSIRALTKTYASGLQALKPISLDIHRGEIFAMLGPNGAGKTTLIGIICGLVRASGGTVQVDGFDTIKDYRKTRSLIGLVPQELHTDTFEKVISTLRFSRGLFGLAPNDAHLDAVLKELSLFDKRNEQIKTLSGGMKRRVLIAKALSHEPRILFLDEPTAGVDVELRHDMWAMVRRLRDAGMTIFLTTHYIQEAEEMADRIGIMNKGELIMVEDKAVLMQKLGKKQVTLELAQSLSTIPASLDDLKLELSGGGHAVTYRYEAQSANGIAYLLRRFDEAGIAFTDLHTEQTSLEEIFVNLVRANP